MVRASPLVAATLLAVSTASLCARARPSFFESSGWTLVDDEPDLRIETTVHGWGDDVSVSKTEWYGDDVWLHGTATGDESDANVQLEYELVDGTWTASAMSEGETADGAIRHQHGVSENNLSGSASATSGSPAKVDLNSGIDDCDPSIDDNCFSGISMVVEGDEVSSDFTMSQAYQSDDGWVATTSANGSGVSSPTSGGTQRVESAGVSVISFFPWLQAAIDALVQGTDGVITNTDSSATVTPAGR